MLTEPIDVEAEETQHSTAAPAPVTPFYSATQLRTMPWADKKGIVCKRWSVKVVLCKSDAPLDLLAERVEYLKCHLEAFPSRDGFIYAGDIEKHQYTTGAQAGQYVCYVALQMESVISFGQVVKALGGFGVDVPRKDESLYFCQPQMGFPYWGLVVAANDQDDFPTYRKERHVKGPLYVRGSVTNAIIPIKFFLKGM